MNQPIATNWVVGNPIDHSMSPMLHNSVYQDHDINARLITRQVSNAQQLVDDIKTQHIPLTAVTMPLKEAILPYLDTISDEASAIGAVNTIINKQGHLAGHNTDIDGIHYALRNTDVRDSKILIIGAGAVAKNMGYYLRQHTSKLYWLNRTQQKAELMVKQFGGNVIDANADDMTFDIIINTTPMGMLDTTNDNLVANLLRANQTVFDVVYNPIKTPLLTLAETKGAHIISGLDMFVAQGLKQIELWKNTSLVSEANLHKIKLIIQRGIENESYSH